MTLMNARMIMDTIEFKDLPIDKSHPHHSAWLWGPDDGLGTLNYLTDDLVAQSSEEIRTGDRVCLNWDLTHPTHPGFGRQAFQHKVFQKGDRTVCDDTVHFNTQHSSQVTSASVSTLRLTINFSSFCVESTRILRLIVDF